MGSEMCIRDRNPTVLETTTTQPIRRRPGISHQTRRRVWLRTLRRCHNQTPSEWSPCLHRTRSPRSTSHHVNCTATVVVYRHLGRPALDRQTCHPSTPSKAARHLAHNPRRKPNRSYLLLLQSHQFSSRPHGQGRLLSPPLVHLVNLLPLLQSVARVQVPDVNQATTAMMCKLLLVSLP